MNTGMIFTRGGGPVGLWMAYREKGPGTHSRESLKMGREGAEEHGYYCHVGFWMAHPLTERRVRVDFL